MKRVIIAAIALLSFTQATQAQKGSILAYGDLSLTTGKDASESKYSSFSINPGIGYQFNNNWTVGVQFGVGTSKDEIGTTGNDNKTSDFNVGPFARYTKSLGSIFSIFGQANASYMTSKASPYNSPSVKTNGFGVNIFPAVGVNVSNGFALNFGFGGIGYNSTKVDAPGAKAASQFNLTFGQQVNVGISKNFSCSHSKKK